jgi:acyl dehydratase
MAIEKLSDIEFGVDLPAFEPDTSLNNVIAFTEAAGWGGRGRFTDHEAARKEGLPGAILPGIMSQGFLSSMILRWAPTADIKTVDTVFRAPVLVDQPHTITGVVTDINEETSVVEIDITITNEKGETRVFGTATAVIPA